MQRESFVFYASWVEAIKDLPNDIRLEIYDGIMEYAITGNLPDFKPMAKVAFNFIKNDLDRNSDKYSETLKSRSESGRLGNLKRYNEDLYQLVKDEKMGLEQAETIAKTRKNSQSVANVTKLAVYDNDNVDVYDNVNEDVYLEGEKKHAPTKPFSKLSKDEFYNSLAEHVGEYSKQTVRDFFDYWTEPSASGKMKFQLEKTWSIPHRLATWKRNEGKFGGVQQAVKPTKKKPYGVWDV
ncbi:TPA: DUF6291 domain-containing protein [Elizabethkingia anophelis]